MWFVFYQSRFEYKQKICEVQKNDLPLHYTLLYKSAYIMRTICFFNEIS